MQGLVQVAGHLVARAYFFKRGLLLAAYMHSAAAAGVEAAAGGGIDGRGYITGKKQLFFFLFFPFNIRDSGQ